jgi:AcrR family transcriptional regulator
MIAATRDLLRTRSYAQLTVDEVMRRATGQGRTVFYRHFDDLADLLLRASREAIEELYEAMVVLSDPVPADHESVIRRALANGVAVYERHGPLLRGIREAAAGDEQIARQGDALRRRFDDLTEQALREMAGPDADPDRDLAETARAITLLNESYLLDAFGREPRVSAETAERTLTAIFRAVAL